MFCYQCEQTASYTGCTKIGVCGKSAEVAALQDLLLFLLKVLAKVAIKARKYDINTHDSNVFICEALFATLTNVNFDDNRIIELIKQAVRLRDDLVVKVHDLADKVCSADCVGNYKVAETKEGMLEQAKAHGVIDEKGENEDISSLKNTLIYGIKGIAAYVDHAQILGQEDKEVYHFVQEALAATLDHDIPLEKWLEMVMQCGQINLRAMELLDTANTGHYGHPVPTKVPLGVKKGKAILVSGHDLRDLELLLQQTEGKGIYVYTHGEMLPCHAYPELKKYKHLYGHYGTAWQNQHKEFLKFPGAILMTTNCIQEPLPLYRDNIFTTGQVGWPQVQHIADKDFCSVINTALKLPGFQEDSDNGFVTTGFAHNAVLGIADKIIDVIKAGKIRHFFLVAGCDGAKPGRNYYTNFVEKVPKDCVVLTLACGKFRFFDMQLGDIEGIPRLIDIGQCNDAYSAIQIALALAKAFDVDVNELPLSLVLSWYEQKAVAILLTLLSLGIKNIRLGPSLPAFLSKNVLGLLVEKFNIKPIATPEKDLEEILGQSN